MHGQQHIKKCIFCSANEELNDLYSSPNIVRVRKSRRMRWAGHVARMGKRRGVDRLLVGKPEGKRPLERPRLIWMDWIELAQDRDRWQALVNAVMNIRFHEMQGMF